MPRLPDTRWLRWSARQIDRVGPGTRFFHVLKRVAVGVYTDGFIHAGNLAYLALLTLFPFFIAAAAIASVFGRTDDGLHAVAAFLRTVPPDVANVLSKPIADVLAARSGVLLWLGGLVGLWSTTSFIETVRDILRRAYGTRFNRPFWEYRLLSIGITFIAVLATMLAFTLQVLLANFETFVGRLVPVADDVLGLAGISRLAQAAILFPALFWLFYVLTPSQYRDEKCPKWPGALLVTLWWMATTALLPRILSLLGGYSLTYGGLAGVIIVLLFFFVIGLGIVVGAELNAALAESPESDLKEKLEAQVKEP